MPQNKPSAKIKRESYWLTQSQMAKACGISTQAFVKWGVQPVAKIGREAFYVVQDVLQNRLVNQAAHLTKSIDTATEQELFRAERVQKLRLTEAQAEGQEIKNAQLRHELAPVDVIEWTLGKVGAQIGAILDALPLQIKKRNPKLTASN